MSKHVEVAELFKKKAARRRRLAKLSFEEMIEIVRRSQKLSRSIQGRRGTPHLETH